MRRDPALVLAWVALLGCLSPWIPAEDALPSSEVLAAVRWTKRPCVQFLEHHARARAAAVGQGASGPGEAGALRLTNTGGEENAAILTALGRPPASADEVDWNATFRRFLVADPPTLNPLFQTTGFEGVVSELLFSVLPIGADWKLDHYGDLDVIESWETSEDGLIDRIVFRDDLTWSDGTRLTAHDVEFSFRTVTDPKIAVPTWRTLTDGLRAVKAQDEKTVLYFQRQALPTNHLHLAWPILPRHILGPQLAEDPTLKSAPFNRAPVTNGPYSLVSWSSNQEILLERREAWYLGGGGKAVRPRPYFKQIRFQILPDNATRFAAFITGQLDETQLDASQWEKDCAAEGFTSRAVKVRGDEWLTAVLGWNLASRPPNPFFGDVRVRRALALAFDHDWMLNELYHGLCRPGAGIFHPDSWMAARGIKPFRRDLVEARRLLTEAGWQDSDGDGTLDRTVDGKLVRFEFEVAVPSAGTGIKVAELMGSSYQRIGVRCTAKSLDPARFVEGVRQRQFLAYLMAWSTGTDPGTASNLWTTKAIDGGRNYSGFSNARVDQLFEEGARERDPDRRARIYAEIDQIIHDEQPVTVLFYQPTLWAFSKDFRGYRHSPRGFYRHSPGVFAIWKLKDAAKQPRQ